MSEDWTRPTTDFWQRTVTADALDVPREPPYRYGYPARLPDGRYLVLPIRRLRAAPDQAVCSLIANQASFAVIDALGGFMAELVRPLAPELVIGLPTLGLAFAPDVARRLGHANYLPLGYSRKFWYEDALSEPVRSLTSPDDGKRLFVDPNLLPRLSRRRAVLVDDAISTGSTIAAALRLLGRIDVDCVAILVAMRQGSRWRGAFDDPTVADRVLGVFDSPLLSLSATGWTPS
jgi:adenine/guanine phosphoribosyltransferase-like PRPP-binding protein